MILPVENEPIIDCSQRGRWEYVRDSETGWRGYMHSTCDAVTSEDGLCIMCGAPCPTVWTELKHD